MAIDPILYTGYVSNELIVRVNSAFTNPSFFWNMAEYFPNPMIYNRCFYKEIKNDYFYLGQNFIEEFSQQHNIKIKDITKMQFNMFFRSKTDATPPPHIDSKESHMVFLCYLNDSDGDTLIYDNDKIIKNISPEKSKYIVFDGSRPHSGSFPIKSYYRAVLNINFVC
jgi:hypothetical protein